MSPLRKLFVALESIATLAWMRLALKFAPRAVLRRATVPSTGTPVDASLVESFRAAAGNAPFGHNCMHRSLALQRVLERRGMHAQLRVGIGHKPNLLPGHAWLEADGQIVNDDATVVSRYVPLELGDSALEVAYRR